MDGANSLDNFFCLGISQGYALSLFINDMRSMQPKDWSIKMNKKERRLATATALQSAAQSITVVDDIKVLPNCSDFMHEPNYRLIEIKLKSDAFGQASSGLPLHCILESSSALEL